MIPIRDSRFSRDTPVVTWTLVGLNALIFLWDRSGDVWAGNQAFADLALHPSAVTNALMGKGDPTDIGQIFTAMFLHGNLAHLVGNLLFLFAFGPNVEAAFGSVKYSLFYLFWGVCAFGAQILVEPHSETPVLGASGAIGGVLGAYFLLFPANRVKIMIPPFVWWIFSVPAFALLGIWFLMQILWPQDGVATWAHAGGFTSGMATVLVLGGRTKILAGAQFEDDKEFDDD
ncbi:MAG: rhomboid family intramembrane serine protease [Armatimonadetes bacterium]|nr:rhomboid family intramembrane serine protease [Armatimonadota bacterium]